MNIKKVVSGGQTGADRAAFEAAIAAGIEIGGFIPKDRLAEDGKIPAKYPGLTETASTEYSERTRLNVLNSDATLILSNGPLSGGSKLTETIARSFDKPVLHIDFLQFRSEEVISVADKWLTSNEPKILNIAGPRASQDDNIYETALRFLAKLFSKWKRDDEEMS